MDDSAGEGTSGHTGARAILRVPEVLAEVAMHPGAGLGELAERLAIPRASLHRMLRTLETGGYLAAEKGRYLLGPASFALSRLIAGVAPTADLVSLARPELERLARETGETVMLGELADDDAETVYRIVIDSSEPVRFSVAAGSRRPLHATASGLAALAAFPPDRLAAWIERARFERFTATTTDRASLPGTVQAARAAGFAFDDGGRAAGAAAVAAAVTGPDGAPVATVSIAGPSERIRARRDRLGEQVRACAGRLSRLAG